MLNAYGRFASLGVQLTASMCVFGWGGFWLDGKLDTYPWLMIVGLMVGAGAGFYALVSAVNTALPGSDKRSKETETTPPKDDSPPGGTN